MWRVANDHTRGLWTLSQVYCSQEYHVTGQGTAVVFLSPADSSIRNKRIEHCYAPKKTNQSLPRRVIDRTL